VSPGAAADAAARRGDARTQALLHAPLLPTLLRLAAPNVVGLVATTVTIAYDGWVVGQLGPDALAGVALVFPLAMLMQQMSGGGLGAATTAAVARALGAGRRDQADGLAVQALWVAACFAALFTVVLVPGGRQVFGAIGGRGAALDAAVAYGQVLFGGALVVWFTNVLAGTVRGGGQMVLASTALVGMAALHLLLCPLLVFGVGRWPGLGIAGAACSTLATMTVAGALLGWRLWRGRGPVGLSRGAWRPQGSLLRSLLRVGLPAMLSPVLSNGSIAVATAWIATLGTTALAGYGLAARLEVTMVPIAFGFGGALTAIVATNLGAGQHARALKATWAGSGTVAAICGAIGVAAAVWPQRWMGLFTADPQLIAFGSAYLQVVGPFYALFGLGLSLFFASQGAGRLFWPLVGSVSRLAVVTIGGLLVLRWMPGQPQALFGVVAAGFVTYAGIITTSIARGSWARAGSG
jgi:putative MATE family efflux protein